MFKGLINNISETIKRKENENNLYNQLLNNSLTIGTLNPIPTIDKKNITISYENILNICPDLNDSKALIIQGILPIDELYLTIMYAKECKTNTEYFLVPTTKYLRVINTNGHICYNYEGLNISIIKNNIMSKVLNLNNILLEVNGTEESINNFINIINNNNYRNTLINDKINTFCGIIPNKRFINNIESGITSDMDKEIVFHTKDFNYRYNINEIVNYELMLDNNVIVERKSNNRARLTSNKNSCYEMNIRITTNAKSFIIPILPRSSFSKLYPGTSTTYIDNLNFAKNILQICKKIRRKKHF